MGYETELESDKIPFLHRLPDDLRDACESIPHLSSERDLAREKYKAAEEEHNQSRGYKSTGCYSGDYTDDGDLELREARLVAEQQYNELAARLREVRSSALAGVAELEVLSPFERFSLIHVLRHEPRDIATESQEMLASVLEFERLVRESEVMIIREPKTADETGNQDNVTVVWLRDGAGLNITIKSDEGSTPVVDASVELVASAHIAYEYTSKSSQLSTDTRSGEFAVYGGKPQLLGEHGKDLITAWKEGRVGFDDQLETLLRRDDLVPVRMITETILHNLAGGEPYILPIEVMEQRGPIVGEIVGEVANRIMNINVGGVRDYGALAFSERSDGVRISGLKDVPDRVIGALLEALELNRAMVAGRVKELIDNLYQDILDGKAPHDLLTAVEVGRLRLPLAMESFFPYMSEEEMKLV